MARRANETGVELAEVGVTPQQVAEIQALVDAGTINDKLARQVFDGVIAGEGTPAEVVAARGLAVVSDDGALGAAVDAAIAANPDVADKIRDGKVQAAGALIGAVMKADARPGRRRPGPRADPGEALVLNHPRNSAPLSVSCTPRTGCKPRQRVQSSAGGGCGSLG